MSRYRKESSESKWAGLIRSSVCVHLGFGLLIANALGAAETPPGRSVIPDLATFCRPSTIQSAVDKLSPQVTIKAVKDGPNLSDGTNFVAATPPMPAYCQVSGSFVTNPKTGRTANFLATFPAAWNGKYLQLGCSGHCGTFAVGNAATPIVTITNQGYPGEIIMKGYASFATDEGHEGMGAGEWAVKGPGQIDHEAIEDFYYRADKVLARLGKEFTAAFYAEATKVPRKISRSYFSGCSGGGRDAFVAASYFPEEFDGIIGGSAYNLMGVTFQEAGMTVASLRSEDAIVTAQLIKRIDPIVKAQCDKVDGVEDGLIQNPAACDFRPERDLPRCNGNAPNSDCFTQAQIETISTVITAVTDEDGDLVQPGFSVSELNPGFRQPPQDLQAAEPWSDTDDFIKGGLWSLANASLKIFVNENDPNFHARSVVSFQTERAGPVTGYRTVVPKAEVSKALAEARVGIGHFPENAANLIKLNRKFLIWHNLSDEKLTPYMSINYYKQLAKLYGGYGKLQNNVRLFPIPGSGHCSMYGVGADNFDALTAMEDWVEKGLAPDALLAKLYDPNGPQVDPSKTPLRTMPLCKFPEMAHYNGRGNVKDAANWTCPSGDTSMLKVGESGRRAGVIE
jgi:feruloyl esterase